jgi:dolichol kinase
MLALIATVFAVFLILISAELWWRKQDIHGEFSRKFVHITVGCFVAFWPYFLSPNYIKLLSLGFIVVVMASRYFGLFQAIHSVQRPTLGEFWFALVVGLLAFLIHHPHVYTAGLLTMALADGLAAIAGTHYGNKQRYIVFGSPKSIIGTATFFAVTIAILIGYSITTPGALPVWALAGVAAGATVLENIAVRGFDNLFVPLFVAGCLFLLA